MCVDECNRIAELLDNKKLLGKKEDCRLFELINDAVAATHVVSNKWEHVTTNIQGWLCANITRSFSLGYFEEDMVLGKVTDILQESEKRVY